MILIIGAGISGLTVARELRTPFLIFEREDRPGGLAGEYSVDGHTFPFGGHYFHFQGKEHLLSELQPIAKFRNFYRDSRVFLKNRFIPFPIQYHLSFLDSCDREAVLRETAAVPAGVAENLQDFLLNHFGDRLYSLFFEPFLQKYYQTDLTRIMAHMDRGSIPVPDRDQMVRGARGERFRETGYNPRFYYPRDYSLNRFLDNYAAPIRPFLKTGEKVIRIDLKRKTVITSQGRYPYRILVNTTPLTSFLSMTADPRLIEASRDLRHISTLVVNGVLACRRRRFHWVYIPERRYPGYRIGYYPTRGRPRFYAEMTVDPRQIPDQSFLEHHVRLLLTATGMISSPREILFLDHRLIPVSYILFDHHWAGLVPPLRIKLAASGVYSIGRYGSWDYSSMTDDMVAAREIAAGLNRR